MAKTEIKADIGLDTTKFQRGLARSQKSVKNFAKSSIGSMVKLGAAFAGIGLVKSMIKLGASAEETAGKFSSVFGSSVEEMNAKILKLKETIPATTKELQDAAAVFGLMAQSFGLNSKASEDFSINMVKIAGDLASFHDIAPEVAFDKLRAGIAGSSEPLQALGIDIREAALKQEALNLGIWDGVGVLSTSQKAMAVQSAVITQMGAASGNAALTINSAANQMKFLERRMAEAGTTIGTAILPVIQDFAEGLRIIGVGIKKLNGEKEVKEIAMDFAAMARANLANRGLLESNVKLVKDFSMFGAKSVKDTEAIARNEALIAERAAELKASYEALNETEKEVLETTGEIAGDSEQILDANKALENSLKAQVIAQGEFAATEKIRTESALKSEVAKKKIQSLKLGLLRAEASQSDTLISKAQKALELEQKIQKIISDTNVDRATAVGLANALTSAQSISATGASGGSGTRKFGESLARFDPTTNKKRKFGESFSRADATNKSQKVKDAMASLAAKNASGQGGASPAENAAKSSADSLKVIEAELTRTK